MNNPIISKTEIKNFLKLAETGHYPLFFEEWVHESLNTNQKLNFKKANHNVRSIFNQLSRHNTIEKKKTALISMDKLTREEFIRSFFKVVEHEFLKENNKLQ